MSDTNRDEEAVRFATQATARSLRQFLKSEGGAPEGSIISVPEREELIGQISQILPVGNVLNFIFSGVVNAKDREVQQRDTEGNMHLRSLLRALAVVRDNAYYRMVFAGPATLLAGYNMLLKLAGADVDAFLPEGAWQFYVEFGLREDSGRHSNETLAFNRVAEALQPARTEQDKLAAWVMASMRLVWDYDALITDLWTEQVQLTTIEETTGLMDLHRAWNQVRPFGVPPEQGTLSIAEYRRQEFARFCQAQLAKVGQEQRQHFEKMWRGKHSQRAASLAAYRRQMTIRSSLEPGEYGEKRVPIRPNDLKVGVVYQDAYYLLDVQDPTLQDTRQRVHAAAAAILAGKGEKTTLDLLLARAPRAEQPRLRKLLDREQQQMVEALRQAPILINWDETSSKYPLTIIRNRRRGVGDHALTLFRTDRSMVFDFSHIYFDGPWAMGVAEILTNDAIYHLKQPRPTPPVNKPKPKPLTLGTQPRVDQALEKLPRAINYLSAERSIDIMPLNVLRQLIAKRTRPAIHVTINDLLVLYRTVFNQRYRPSESLTAALTALAQNPAKRPLIVAISEMMRTARATNPSMMIPIDAIRIDPKERIFPSAFRSPFPDFLAEHDAALKLRRELHVARIGVKGLQEKFNRSRVAYLGGLNAFSQLMKRYREIATHGQSMSTTAIRLIAGLPGAMQRLADGIPGRFAFVNEAIKGEEVFSNVGQVVPGSSLSRFASAKDDNDKKVLVWGIMTTNDQQLTITLRDFRPPVTALAAAGHPDIALRITHDLLYAYMDGLLVFLNEMTQILAPLHA